MRYAGTRIIGFSRAIVTGFLALVCFVHLSACSSYKELFPQEVSRNNYYDFAALDIYVDLVGCSIGGRSECLGSIGTVVNVFAVDISSITLDTISIKIDETSEQVLLDTPRQVELETKDDGTDRRGYLNLSVVLPSSSRGKRALVKVRGFLTRVGVEEERVGVDVEFLIRKDSGYAWPR